MGQILKWARAHPAHTLDPPMVHIIFKLIMPLRNYQNYSIKIFLLVPVMVYILSSIKAQHSYLANKDEKQSCAQEDKHAVVCRLKNVMKCSK